MDETVDIGRLVDTEDGFCHIGHITSTEYLGYLINSGSAGDYDILLRIASLDVGKQISIAVNAEVVGTAEGPGEGWNEYRDVWVRNVSIPAGDNEIEIRFPDGSINFNYFEIQPASTAPEIDPGDGVPQPPASCSNVDEGIPNNIRIHTLFDSVVPRSEFADNTKWYNEDGNIQRFQARDGDTNLRPNTTVKRPRIEAHNTAAQWRANGATGWHEFSANYYLSDWDMPQEYVIFQIKTNDASNFIIQGVVRPNGRLSVARRSKGHLTLDDNVFQKPFHFRVRSNGRRFEVYYNCELVIAEDHPQPQLENDATRYGWRWGLYRQNPQPDVQIGTTTLYVTGPQFD